jgi:hypothetical protein
MAERGRRIVHDLCSSLHPQRGTTNGAEIPRRTEKELVKVGWSWEVDVVSGIKDELTATWDFLHGWVQEVTIDVSPFYFSS